MSDPRDRFIREAQVQRGLVELLELFGWTVWLIGQRDARGTQTPGVSDILATHPQCGILFVEAKRTVGGRQSLVQKGFQRSIEAAGGTYILAASVEALRTELEHRRRHARAAR